MASSNLQIREEQPPNRPQPAQIARDRGPEANKEQIQDRAASDVKEVPFHDRIIQFPGQHPSVRDKHDILHCLQRSCFIKEKHFVIPL